MNPNPKTRPAASKQGEGGKPKQNRDPNQSRKPKVENQDGEPLNRRIGAVSSFRSLAVSYGLALLLAASFAARAELETFFGEDVSPHPIGGPNTVVRPTGLATTMQAAARFYARLTGTSTESFESYNEAESPGLLTFGTNTATLAGQRNVRVFASSTQTRDGLFPITGTRCLDITRSSLDAYFTVGFSQSQAAFGFFGTDVELNQLRLVLVASNGDRRSLTVPVTVPQGTAGAFFFGVIDRATPFAAVEFHNEGTSGDGFGFDDLTIGTPEQVVPAQLWTTNNLPSGLISWWNADGHTLDVTGLNPASSSGQTYVPGRFGQAFHFNGVNQSVAAPGSASLDQWTQFTLEAWMNLDKTEDVAGGAPGRMVVNRVGHPVDHVNFNQGYQFGFYDNARKLVLNFNTNGQVWESGFITIAPLAAPLPTNVWLHVAATYDHNAVKLYLNGVPLTTNVVGPATVAHSTSAFRIGMDDNGNCPFPGRIDDVRVYSRALTETEVASLALRLMLVNVGSVGTNFTFAFQTVSNFTYTVEYNDELGTTNWLFHHVMTGDGSLQPVLIPMTNGPQRFFRVRQP